MAPITVFTHRERPRCLPIGEGCAADPHSWMRLAKEVLCTLSHGMLHATELHTCHGCLATIGKVIAQVTISLPQSVQSLAIDCGGIA